MENNCRVMEYDIEKYGIEVSMKCNFRTEFLKENLTHLLVDERIKRGRLSRG